MKKTRLQDALVDASGMVAEENSSGSQQLEGLHLRIAEKSSTCPPSVPLEKKPNHSLTLSSDEMTLARAAISLQVEKMHVCFENSESNKRLVRIESSARCETLFKREDACVWYAIGKVVGRGTFGRVQLASHRLTNTNVAVKSYYREKGSLVCSPTHHHPPRSQPAGNGNNAALEWKRVRQEVKLMAALNPHPGLVQFVEAFETPTQIQLVMEFASGGSLCDLLKKYPQQRLPEAKAKCIFADLCRAVTALHDQNVIHRDLKLENVLLDDTLHPKIIDFGFSQREYPVSNENEGGLRTARDVKNFCGTPSYMAPEVVSCKSYDGKLVDVWSLGIILYLLLCGKFPFQATNLHQLYQTIRTTQVIFPGNVSREAQDLVRSMLVVAPDKRLPLVLVPEHSWIKNQRDKNEMKLCERRLRAHAFEAFMAWEEGVLILYTEVGRLYGLSSESLLAAWQKARHNSLVALGRLCLLAAEKQFFSTLSLKPALRPRQEQSALDHRTHKQQLELLIGLVQQSLER